MTVDFIQRQITKLIREEHAHLESQIRHMLNQGHKLSDLTVVENVDLNEGSYRKRRVSIAKYLGKVCYLNKMGLDSELRDSPLHEKIAFRGRITCHGLAYVECFCEADRLYYLFPFDHINVLETT